MKAIGRTPRRRAEFLKTDGSIPATARRLTRTVLSISAGEKTDIIKIMGHRISPGEIEAVLNGISCVRESAVVECILGDLPAIKAFIVPGDECSIERIKNAAASKLPYFMRPHIYELIPELPKTDTGKLRRSALRQIPCAE